MVRVVHSFVSTGDKTLPPRNRSVVNCCHQPTLEFKCALAALRRSRRHAGGQACTGAIDMQGVGVEVIRTSN